MAITEASRSFSHVLNRVAAGEQIEVTRNGSTVAVISPARAERLLSPERFRDVMQSLPQTDDEFIRDLEEIRRDANQLPQRDPRES